MSTCKSCNAEIIWLGTANGKKMPVDAATVQPQDSIFDHTRHTSHFATCPGAAAHRKPKEPKP